MGSLLQAACATRTLVVDRTPPTIVSTTPFQYQYAAAGELISARFSEPIAAGSVTAATAKATGNAILKGTITDLAGNPLGRDTTWTWRWANAVSVGPSLPSQVGESGGFDPAVAAGPDGLPVVAWRTEGTTVEPTRSWIRST